MPHFTCNFLSYTLDRAVDIDVIIPGVTSTEAEQPGVTHRPKAPYPVLYLLHGYCNDYSTWERYTSIERYAEERRIAVVTFSGENNFYCRTADFRGPSPVAELVNPDYDAFLEKELPDFVTSMFPVSRRRSETYIAGLSMGGFGALYHGYRYPSHYRAVGAFSPLTTLHRAPWEDPSAVEPAFRRYEPLLLMRKARQSGRAMPPLYYAYGNDDFLKDIQDWFAAALDKDKLPHTLDNLDGYGHEWAFWDLEVKRFLDWIPRDDVYYRDNPIRRI